MLIASPDRLARRYAYQVWLLEEFERAGCAVIFLERPPTGDPQDALVMQIRGAVAEYERTVIADRMRRGRLAALRAGQLLPWSQPPYGYRLDPRPRATRRGCSSRRSRRRWCGRSSAGTPRRASPSTPSPNA